MLFWACFSENKPKTAFAFLGGISGNFRFTPPFACFTLV